jgi:hypothetical protein
MKLNRQIGNMNSFLTREQFSIVVSVCVVEFVVYLCLVQVLFRLLGRFVVVQAIGAVGGQNLALVLFRDKSNTPQVVAGRHKLSPITLLAKHIFSISKSIFTGRLSKKANGYEPLVAVIQVLCVCFDFPAGGSTPRSSWPGPRECPTRPRGRIR